MPATVSKVFDRCWSLQTELLARSGLPSAIAEWVQIVFTTKVSFLLAVNVFLFFVGMFIETSAAILVLAPLLPHELAANHCRFGSRLHEQDDPRSEVYTVPFRKNPSVADCATTQNCGCNVRKWHSRLDAKVSISNLT